MLAEGGAELVVADVDQRKRELAERLGAEWTDPLSALTADVDVVAPCALGGVLNDETVPALRCRAIAGAANNQLAVRRARPGAGRARDPVGAGLRLQRRRHHQHLRRARARRLLARARRHARARRRRHAAPDLRQRRRPPGRRRCAPRSRSAASASARRRSRPSSRSFSRCARSVTAANGRTAAGASSQAASSSASSPSTPASSAASSLRSRSARWARYSSSFAAGSVTSSPWPGHSTRKLERAQAPQPVEVLAQPAADEHAALAEHGVAGERGAAGDEHEVVVGVAGDGEHGERARTCPRPRSVARCRPRRRDARAARAPPPSGRRGRA